MATAKSLRAIRRLRSKTMKVNGIRKAMDTTSPAPTPAPTFISKSTNTTRTKYARRNSASLKTSFAPVPAPVDLPKKRRVTSKKIVPTKKDAVFGRGRKKDHVRNGSLYRYLIEKNFVAYASLGASETKARKAFVKTKIIDALRGKGGRFIVRDGDIMSFLHVDDAADLKLIFKKIQRALFNERKRREDAEDESKEKNKPSKVFVVTVYEDDDRDEEANDETAMFLSDYEDEDSVMVENNDTDEEDLDEEEALDDDDDDLEVQGLPPRVEKKTVASKNNKMEFDMQNVCDDDKEVASLDNEERPSSRASLKLDQLAYLATTLLEEAANVSSDEDEDDESIILGIGRSRTPSPLLMTPSTAPTASVMRACSRLPFKKRKSQVIAAAVSASATSAPLTTAESYNDLGRRVQEGSVVLPATTMMSNDDAFNQAWMRHLRRELFPATLSLKPRITPNFEDQLNLFYAPVTPFFSTI